MRLSVRSAVSTATCSSVPLAVSGFRDIAAMSDTAHATAIGRSPASGCPQPEAVSRSARRGAASHDPQGPPRTDSPGLEATPCPTQPVASTAGVDADTNRYRRPAPRFRTAAARVAGDWVRRRRAPITPATGTRLSGGNSARISTSPVWCRRTREWSRASGRPAAGRSCTPPVPRCHATRSALADPGSSASPRRPTSPGAEAARPTP